MTNQDVSRPWVRKEVIDALREVSVGESAKWMRDDPSEIDYIVHLFFDDNDLADDPIGLIGDVLLNADEAYAVKGFTSSLENLISELRDSSTVAYYNHAGWLDVRSCANRAYAELTRN